MTLPPLHLKPQIQTGNQKQLKEIVTTLNLYHQKKEEISRPEKYYEKYPYALLHAIISILTAKLYEKWVTSKINAKVIYKSSACCFSVTWEILNTVSSPVKQIWVYSFATSRIGSEYLNQISIIYLLFGKKTTEIYQRSTGDLHTSNEQIRISLAALQSTKSQVIKSKHDYSTYFHA